MKRHPDEALCAALMLSKDEAALLADALDVYTRRLRPKSSRAFRGVPGADRDEPSTVDRLLLIGGRLLCRLDRVMAGRTDDRTARSEG